MNAPAAAWSCIAVNPKMRGAAAYVGYSTRFEKARKAESAVFARSAVMRYGTTAQRDQCARLGQGCSTVHQKSSDVKRKHACSTSCQAGDRKASSYAAGTCQLRYDTFMAIQPVAGY